MRTLAELTLASLLVLGSSAAPHQSGSETGAGSSILLNSQDAVCTGLDQSFCQNGRPFTTSAPEECAKHFKDNNIEFITGCTGIRTISVTITTTVGPSVLPSLSMPSHPHPQHLVTIAPAPNEVQIRDSLADIPDGFDIDADRIPEIVVPDDCSCSLNTVSTAFFIQTATVIDHGCMNIRSNNHHCGRCGKKCPVNSDCFNGACTSPTCPQVEGGCGIGVWNWCSNRHKAPHALGSMCVCMQPIDHMGGPSLCVIGDDKCFSLDRQKCKSSNECPIGSICVIGCCQGVWGRCLPVSPYQYCEVVKSKKRGLELISNITEKMDDDGLIERDSGFEKDAMMLPFDDTVDDRNAPCSLV